MPNMRVLSYLFKLSLVSLIVGALIWLFGGYIWLSVGTYNFINDVWQLPLLNRNLAVYMQMCARAPEGSENSVPKAFALRFVDERNYVVELVCSLIEDSPIQIKTGSLPMFITRNPGSSGFIFWLDDKSGTHSALRLTSLRHALGVELRGDTVVKGNQIQEIASEYPHSTCQARLFTCCAPGSQLGVGEALNVGVTDCPQSCFLQCKNVPFIEVFGSDPGYEPQTRELMMSDASLDVIFNYSVLPKTVDLVTMDFGDGTTQTSSYSEGIFVHTYVCEGSCKFTAALVARDADGSTSVDTSNAKIYIIRR